MARSAALIALLAATVVHAQAVVVIHNAKVVTIDKAFALAEAVVVKGESIAFVGGNAECLKLAGPGATRIDAARRVVMPGLQDSHTHPSGACVTELEGAAPRFESIGQVQDFIRAETRKKAKGQWIVLEPIFPTRLREGRLPTRVELDAAAPDHPVLWNAQPLFVVNGAALAKSGITRETKDPPSGTLDRDPKSGEPTGVLRSARDLLKGLPASASLAPELHTKALVHLLSLYNQYGITAIGDRGAGTEAIDRYRALARAGKLTVRVNCTRMTSAAIAERDPETCRIKLAALCGAEQQYGPTGAGDDWVRMGPLKVMLDGGMLSGTAYMRDPWGVGPTYQIADPAYRGQLRSDLTGLRTLYRAAARQGWQLTAHTAGEAALDALLDIYEAIHRDGDICRRRMLVTHANFQSEENLRRCRQLGVCADVQPAWFFLDGDSLLKTLGPRRMRWFLPLKSWQASTVIGGGSDHMLRLHPDTSINPWNPWLGIWVAVTRQTAAHRVIEPDERLSREDALRLYTIHNAYLHFQEDKIGSLEPGKYADLIMLDRDVLTCPVDDIRHTHVVLTMVGGKVVHDGRR